MNAKNIVEQLTTRKGQHVFVTWRRKLKTLKTCSLTIEKETKAFVRAGIDYSHLASVREGIASGEREEVQPLPSWCEWIQFPFTLRHKANRTEYVRLYPASFANLKPVVRYFVNGIEAKAEDIKPFCYASEFEENETAPACFMVKAESISEIAE